MHESAAPERATVSRVPPTGDELRQALTPYAHPAGGWLCPCCGSLLRITLAVLTDEQSTPVGEHGWKGQGPSSEPPHDYWRPLPCGHPPDPVAWVGPNGPVCHCAAILDPADGIEVEGAPGPVVQCTRCGCAVAVPDA